MELKIISSRKRLMKSKSEPSFIPVGSGCEKVRDKISSLKEGIKDKVILGKSLYKEYDKNSSDKLYDYYSKCMDSRDIMAVKVNKMIRSYHLGFKIIK